MKKLTILLLPLTFIVTIVSQSGAAHLCATSLKQHEHLTLHQDRQAHFASHQYKSLKASPQRGEQRTFWTWDLTVMPPGFQQTEATCRKVGQYCYIFVADDQWTAGNVDQADVNIIVHAFDDQTPQGSIHPDQGIYEIETTYFGAAPDALDNDPKIYILLFDIGNFHGYTFDGYFNVYDQFPDSYTWSHYQEHSNEVEIFYIDTDPTNPSADSTLAVLAHEFQHMIHWNMDEDESNWLNEGCSEYAMILCGYDADGHESTFANKPDTVLTEWNNQSEDYGASMLFAVYLAEHYGGPEFMRALVANQANSIAGVNNTLQTMAYQTDFRAIFQDWVLANYLNDPTINNGFYSYQSMNIPSFREAKIYTSIPPVSPPENGDVNKWGTDYFKFTNGNEQLNILFTGQTGKRYSVSLISKGFNQRTIVQPFELDALNIATCQAPEFGSRYPNAVMVVANVTDAGSGKADYSYTLTQQTETDITPPHVEDYWPRGVDIPVDTQISFKVLDLQEGVDMNSLAVNINGISMNVNTQPLGADGFSVQVIPPALLDANAVVVIEVNACDLVGNCMQSFSWAFKTSADRPPITPTPQVTATETPEPTTTPTPVPASPRILLAGLWDTLLTEQNGGRLTFIAIPDDPDGLGDIAKVEVYLVSQPAELYLNDEGRDGDFVANDGMYGLAVQFPPSSWPGTPTRFSLGIVATDASGEQGSWPMLTVK